MAKGRDGERESRALTAAVAEKVFGWKNVRMRAGERVGKKQDKLGRWRTGKVPDYAAEPRQAYAIDQRMKELGRSERYRRELAKITRAEKLPDEWATPELRGKAALKALSGSRRQSERP